MPFTIQDSRLIAYETLSDETPDPLPTLYAQLIAGWVCPECDEMIRAIAGPWNQSKAEWWKYDHKYSSHSSDHSIHPRGPKDMPRFRGFFDTSGGYLRRIDHPKPLRQRYDHPGGGYKSKCDLAISLRVGIEGGLSALPDISDQARNKLVEIVSASNKWFRLIPEITGVREPIIATTREAAAEWQRLSFGTYDPESKVKAWEQFVSTCH